MNDIDHVTLAASSLTTLTESFGAVGIPPEYGGVHGNGVTEMAVVGFRDGSYIECISTVEQGTYSPLWHDYIRHDGGPCAWALRTEDISKEVSRLHGESLDVEGPIKMARNRPDGFELQWEIATLGRGDPGGVLPFFITDETPRERRISPTPAAADSELTGIERVIITVHDLDRIVERFHRAFPMLPDTATHTSELLESKIVRFPDSTPVLAQPTDESWLAERLLRFGASPCCFPVGTHDFDRSMDRFDLDMQAVWGNQRVGWSSISSEPLSGVGVIEVREDRAY